MLESSPALSDTIRTHVTQLCASTPQPNEWHSPADVRPLLQAAELLVQLGDADAALAVLQPAVYDPNASSSPINQLGEWDDWRAVAHILNAVFQYDQNVTRPADRLALYTALGTAYERLYSYPLAQPILDKALALARTLNDRQAESVVLSRLASILWDQGKRAQALEFDTMALALARQNGNRRLEGILLNNIGILYMSFGKLTQAIAFLNQAWKIAQREHNTKGEMWYIGNISEALIRTGDYAHTLAFIDKSLGRAERLAGPTIVCMLLLNKAECLWRMGQESAAEEIFADCLRRAQKNNSLTDQIEAILGSATLALHRRNMVTVRAAVRRAESDVALAIQTGSTRTRLVLLLLEVQSAAAVVEGLYLHATGLYRRMAELAAEAGSVDFEARALVGLATISEAQNDRKEAFAYLARAYRCIHESEDRSHAEVIAFARHLATDSADFAETIHSINGFDPALATKLVSEVSA